MKKIIVIGGGPGGYVAAIRAAQLGADVTIIEKQYLGGTCLNVGCIPTKCLLHSAELVEQIKTQGKDIGVEVEGVKVNFPQVIAHKNAISKQLTQGVAGLLKQNKVTRVDGEASFTGPKTLSVKKSDGSVEEMTADAIIVATGSVNAQPPIPGLKENPNCIDSTGALSLEKLPKSMVVIGGVIGLELVCAYAAFGTKITVVEALDHMLPMLDGDLTAIGVKHMKKMGMEFNLECPVQAVEASPVGAKVVCKNKAGETVSFEAEKVLVAIGRKANTASLNLEAAGLANDRGRIIVNDKMETSVPGVYAIGDCVKGYAQLAHTASAMGEVAAELGITVATLSVTVKRLYAKGYVERRSDLADRRLVLVGLTEKGRRAARVHQYFHGLMMKRALGKLDDAQMEVLKTALVERNQYFEDYLASQGVFCKAESK